MAFKSRATTFWSMSRATMKLLEKWCMRGLLWFTACGMVLVGSSVASASSVSKGRLQLEAAACKQIRAVPLPSPGASTAVALLTSTLAAFKKTGNASFETFVEVYDKAARARDNDEMIRALDNAVKVCHRLGLKTAS